MALMQPKDLPLANFAEMLPISFADVLRDHNGMWAAAALRLKRSRTISLPIACKASLLRTRNRPGSPNDWRTAA